MRTITFGSIKRKFLVFEAEEAEFAPDGADFIISASGRITFQDVPAMEEILALGRYACHLTVHETGSGRVEHGATGQELMHGRYLVTFLILEPEHFVARIESDI